MERLLEYKMYKYMSYELRDLQMDAEKGLYRERDLPKEVQNYRAPVDLDELLANVDTGRLNQIFQEVMKRSESRVDPVRSSFGQMEKEEVNLEAPISYVESYIADNRKVSFRKLLTIKKSRMHVIITFLTILEIMKTGRIEVEQDDIFAEIMITAKE